MFLEKMLISKQGGKMLEHFVDLVQILICATFVQVMYIDINAMDIFMNRQVSS